MQMLLQMVSVLFYGRKEMFESKNYNISHIIDRIGAGDAFMVLFME
jgi:sugar/nucleoside kinase (ribokinase family)